MSHGRKKRSTPTTEGQTEETLSAIIRVLAKGEEEELQSSNQTSHSVHHLGDLVCMSETWFVSSVVSVSVLCLLLSALIVVWGCHSLNTAKSKLPM
ncbi:hypothetical protein ANCCAN_06261 [Ancylostoma caninum]|uniref:Uncharacterized protein n=1 Tax=Ancylostoma caninum TaxID=29170 RepID=A0A368GTI9_ANCCA|nr:hypothetical protein ANCCAN_06261 [Ancylostoma caninum]